MKFSILRSCGPTALMTAAGILLTPPLPAADAENIAPLDLARQLNDAFVNVAANVSESVVVIQVAYRVDPAGGLTLEELEERHPWLDELPDSLKQQLLPETDEDSARVPNREPDFSGNGSGVIISPDGFILTNHHVVDNAAKIRVRLKDGREFDATVRGTDKLSEIAVIRLVGEVPKDLKAAAFADSDSVRVGEYAIAIGAPFALDYSVTVGHVSAMGRSGVVPWYMDGNLMDQAFIQTDANINPGNSGGPLVNLDGRVMGINTMIRGLGTGIGFAVPSNLARMVADELIENGSFERAWLGIGIRDLREFPNPDAIAPGLEAGMVVVEIPRDAAAFNSDLKTSDVIVAVEGVKVETTDELRAQVRAKPIGSTLMIDVVRGTQELRIDVKTGPIPESQLAGSAESPRRTTPDPEPLPLGITVDSVDSASARELGVSSETGVVVVAIEADSDLADLGMTKGTVITEINHQEINSLEDYRDALRSADLADGVLFDFVDTEGNRQLSVLRD